MAEFDAAYANPATLDEDVVCRAENDTVTLDLPLRGHSAHPKPLVSVFELAAISPRNRDLSDPADLGDAVDHAESDPEVEDHHLDHV